MTTRVRQLLIGLASGSAFYSGLVPALGLGEITLHSALNQPLEAEIELLEVADLSASDMRVRLAPAEVFTRSGVDRLVFLNDLRFTPLLRGGKSVIRVVSSQPVHEPYLNFIVEVARPNGQLFREYTVLLDPPGSSAYRSVAQAPVAQAPASRPAAKAPVAAPRVMPSAHFGQRYQVASGDSLWTIAARLRSAGSPASQQRLMGDIQALNPQAFANGDINRLRAGAYLLLPDTAVSAAPASQAPEAVATAQPLTPQPPPVDPQAELIAQVQRQVEEELAGHAAENLQLQQSMADLQLQFQQLQAQLNSKDQQVAALQAELAARQTPAEPVPAPVVAVDAQLPAVAASEPAGSAANNWIGAAVALLMVLLAGCIGLFWRNSRQVVVQPESDDQAMPESAEVIPQVLVQPPKATAVRAEAPVPVAASRSSGANDTLEGANIYIAYGRFNEAAATLRNALAAEPQRSDIRFRLLEVLAQMGDARGFSQEEAILRDSGFAAAPIDQLKVRHPDLLVAAPVDALDDVLDLELSLDETPPPQPLLDELTDDDFQLNLDNFSLDPDWDLVSPFSPPTRNKAVAAAVAPGQATIDSSRNPRAENFGLAGERDARSPFANSMLVEETADEGWFEDELQDAFISQPLAEDSALLSDLDHLAARRDNLARFNQALAYIEQGDLESACSILNQLINDGDEEQKREASELLAKIA